jgi:putative chitinase
MSDALKILQARCGVKDDGSFGPNTARAIAKHYELSDKHGAHLLGQAHHESGGFKRTKEGLYYSTPERLMAVWPSRFKSVEAAMPYTKNPEALANKVYNGRMGNEEGSSDGWKFSGKGFIQLTGRSNFRSFSSDMRLPDVMKHPAFVETEYAFESALWFFRSNKLFTICDKGVDDDTIKAVTKRVNGGTHGLKDRIEQTKKIYEWLTAA